MARKPKNTETEPLDTVDTVAETPEVTNKLRPRLPFDQFILKLTGLAPADCPSLYIYRTRPRIDIKNSGREHKYLEKLSEIPAELRGHIKTVHGGGEYQLQLNADNRQPSAVAECILDIPIAEADPILDPVELVRGKPDAEQLITRWVRDGKVYIDGQGIVRAAQPGAGGTAGAPTQSNANNTIADKVMSKALDKMLDPPKENSSLSEALLILKALKDTSGSDGGPMMALMQKQLLASESRNHELMMKMLEAKEKDGDNLETTIATLERMGKTFGVTAGGGTHWAVDLAKELAKAAAPLFGSYMMMTGKTAAAPDAAVTPGGGNPAPDVSSQMPTQVAQIRQFTLRVLSAVKNGRTGEDFAYSMVDMLGEDRYNQLAAAGKEVLITTMRSFPDITPELDKVEAELSIFVDDFLKAFEEDEPPNEGANKPEGVPTGATA